MGHLADQSHPNPGWHYKFFQMQEYGFQVLQNQLLETDSLFSGGQGRFLIKLFLGFYNTKPSQY
jgi:hypothetical protein